MSTMKLIRPKLKRLKLSAMADTLEQHLHEASNTKWSYSEFLNLLLQEEIETRDQKLQMKRLA